MEGATAEAAGRAARWSRLAASPAAPLALFALGWLAARAVGFEIAVDWQRWQLLDRVALAAEPGRALWYLHAQPPALNAIAAAVLAAASIAGTAPETIVAVLFAGLAAAAIWLVHRLLLGLIGPFGAFAGALAVAAAPGFWVFAFDLFYPLPLFALAAALLLAALSYLRGGASRALAGVVAAAVGLAWTSALYAPPVALGLVALVAALGPGATGAAERRRRRRRAAVALATTALLVAPWPAKNALVFGRPVSSSWLGYNLSNMSGVRSASLSSYLESGDPGPAAWRWWRARAPRGAADEPLLVAPEKSGGGRNWNHFVFLYSAPGLVQVSRSWMLEHPVRWLTRALSNYARCTRPVDVHPYLGTPLGPSSALLRGWRALWSPLFVDLRPPIERLAPGLALHRLARS
ncbi:MAG TPA: hypothetical protein VLA66_00995, partial [Thermoanaerobaculia bacterium]|nr:hypothetical protein [Thermoanaerobaculia bacterium]